METLSLSFRSPSRNKRCVMNSCLTDRITALAADIPHRSFMWTFRCCRCGFHCGLRPNALTDNNRPTRDVQSVADISYCAEVTYNLTRPPNKSLSNCRQKKKSVDPRTQVVSYIKCIHGITSVIEIIRQEYHSMQLRSLSLSLYIYIYIYRERERERETERERSCIEWYSCRIISITIYIYIYIYTHTHTHTHIYIPLSKEFWKVEVNSGAWLTFSKCVSLWFWARNSSSLLTARSYMPRVFKLQPTYRTMQPAATFVN